MTAIVRILVITIGLFCWGITSPAQADLQVLNKKGQPLDRQVWQSRLLEARVVFVGEHHDRFDHHLNQLSVIRALYEQDESWVIGLEMFQQPFQSYLDAYISGAIDEREVLQKTQYFERWGFDYRLYRPILRYAREQGIALVALNIPDELSRKVGRVGLAGLSPDERAQLPAQIDKSDSAYRQRLKAIFAEHPAVEQANFEYFFEAQLAWDEGMAERAADYLDDHPQKSMIVLAGSGHLQYGSGIPRRLQRRLGLDSALLLQIDEPDDPPRGADYLILTEPSTIEPAGRMGVMLDLEIQNQVNAQQVLPDSAAAEAGMRDADQILAISGWQTRSFADVRLALMDKKPGDEVTIKVQRGTEILDLSLTLQ